MTDGSPEFNEILTELQSLRDYLDHEIAPYMGLLEAVAAQTRGLLQALEHGGDVQRQLVRVIDALHEANRLIPPKQEGAEWQLRPSTST